MRIAFVGKGGVGKSAIAGTFARCLARLGGPVLAVDSDPMPGLAFSLGLEIDDSPIPDEAVEEKPEGEEGPRFRLRSDLSPSQAVELYAAAGPDGVRFLQLGKWNSKGTSMFRSQFAFRQIMEGLVDEQWNLVGDLPGGTRQAFAGWGNYAHTFLIVTEPTAKSMLSTRRLARLALAADGDKAGAQKVVALVNKVREPGDVEMVAQRTGLEVVGWVPWDEALADAERLRKAPIDEAPMAPAVLAVESLVERLSEEYAG